MSRLVAIGLCLGIFVTFTPSPADAGVHYKASTRVVSDQKGADSGNYDVEGWISGGQGKVLFTTSANPMTPDGTYLLTTDGAQTVYLVDDKEKTYMEWDIEAMLQLAGAVMEAMGPMMSFEFVDPTVEKLLEEDGGEIAGVDVTHYRFKTSYGLQMKIMGMKRNQEVTVMRDVWSNDDYEDIALGMWLRKDFSTGQENLDEMIRTQMETVSGFPLKSVDVTTTTDQKGRESVSTTTMEVTLWEEVSIPDSTFELDPTYQQTAAPLPVAAESGGDGEESQNPLAGLFGRKKKRN